MLKLSLTIIHLVTFLLAFTPAFAQPGKAPSGLTQIAMYEGPDRVPRLIQGAKNEGSLLLYTNIAATDLEKIAADFAKRYGIKLNVWRALADKVLQRVLTEANANRFEVDVVQLASPQMEALHREKFLQEMRSPYFKDLIPGAVAPHKEWAASFLSVYVQAYNTNKVKKAELPKRYQDLLDPKWKNRLGINTSDKEWFSSVVQAMGEENGLKFFKDLIATNGIFVRTGGASLLMNSVVSGEVPLGLTVYNFMPEQAKQKGAPVDWFVFEPAIAHANAVGVAKKAPHPHAAALYFDYMLGAGQPLLVKLIHIPTNKKYESPLKSIPMTLVDPVTMLDENDKWTRLYEDIVLNRGSR
ncbi:MAG TPA: extracellular solute-binding protein [Acidiferrobacterales bacterium]|nr:extracellular solute-binding protein [Acidiferrobacterales bacterium]